MKKQRTISDKVSSWLFLSPTLIFLLVTAFVPLLYSVYLSFYRMKLNLPNVTSQFVGFENYARMLTDKLLHISTINTGVFALVSVAIETVVGLMVAMVFCSDKKWARIATSVFIIPMIDRKSTRLNSSH